MKRIFKIGTVILVVVCLLTFLIVPVSAVDISTYSFNVPFSRPEVHEGFSYFEVVYYDENYNPYFAIFYLNQDFHGPTKEFVLQVYNNKIIVVPLDSSTDLGITYLYRYTLHNDTFSLLGSFDLDDSPSKTLNFPYGIGAVYPYGVVCDTFSNSEEFVINYSSNGIILDFLSIFSNALQTQEGILSDIQISSRDILDYITNIYNSNTAFYQELVDYFQDNEWSLLSNIDTNLIDIFNFLKGSSSSPGLFYYLSIIGQDIRDSKSYLESLQDLEQNTHVQAPDSESFNPNFDSTAPPRDDSTIQDIADAEEEALGGMTQEEVKEQVDETFDTESKIEEVGGEEINVENITIVNNLFGDMFSVFGGAWSTFFILNLTIAFAAFLIGRKY